MKKILSLLTAGVMLFFLSGALAQAEEAAGSRIVGRFEDGCYFLTVQANPDDAGEWTADEMAQDDSVVALAYARMENGAFVAKYEPRGDGEVSVQLRHYTEHRVCDEIHTFDLLVKDGKVQENTGGSYTASPLEEDLNPWFSGEWLEKDTQFITLDVTRQIAGGWLVEMTSPLSHGAWLLRATAYFDCDYNAFVYADGVKYDLPTEDGAPEVKMAENLWGTLRFSEEEAPKELVWYGMELSEGQEISFERAPALPAYVYPGTDETEGAVANGLASGDLAAQYLQEPGMVTIPVVNIHKTEAVDETHAKVYGSFWVLNYVKRGSVLQCVSGGEYAGLANLEKNEGGWQMVSLEPAGDGDDYAEDLKRFANGDQELLQKYFDMSDLSQAAQQETRTRMIREYVEANSLPITAYQDYGWDPVPLY